MHDNLHENLFISTSSFHWNKESGWESVFEKKLMVKTHLLKGHMLLVHFGIASMRYVVGTNWNCLYEAIPMCTYNICYWK